MRREAWLSVLTNSLDRVRQTFLKRTGIVNTTPWQRRHWDSQLALEAKQPWEKLGHTWGDPKAAQDRLGNYRHVYDILMDGIRGGDACVLEIGSYGGKWTQHLLNAKRVICVDLFERSYEVIRQRFGERRNIEFYKTQGDELLGIPSDSVDLVFSMDTLVRVPLASIRKYLDEIFRVLAPRGRVLLHLPCDEIEFCRVKAFTRMSRDWIRRSAEQAGFRDIHLDSDTLRHGVLLLALKENGARHAP